MIMSHENAPLTRRKFVRRAATGAGLLAACGTLVTLVNRTRTRAVRDHSVENPLAYRLDHLDEVDPKWLHHESPGRFQTPLVQSRRITVGPEDRIYIGATAPSPCSTPMVTCLPSSTWTAPRAVWL